MEKAVSNMTETYKPEAVDSLKVTFTKRVNSTTTNIHGKIEDAQGESIGMVDYDSKRDTMLISVNGYSSLTAEEQKQLPATCGECIAELASDNADTKAETTEEEEA